MKKILLACFATIAMLYACGSDDDVTIDNDNGNNTETVNIDSDYTYELPVIFHVLYQDQNNSSQYIPYQRLANILQYVNEIYQGNIYGESENVHLKFVLATKDESGKTLRHPGVEYVHYTGDYPIDPNEFMSDNSGKNVRYIWDPNNYINVMMYNFKQEDSDQLVLGISHMPYCVAGHEVAGLEKSQTANLKKSNLAFAYCSSINSLYASQGSQGYYQSDRYTNKNHQPSYISSVDVVVTLAHELGHYLGLFHAFTEKTTDSGTEPVDSCADTDYCSDTKSYNYMEYQEYMKYLMTTNPNADVYEYLRRNACDGTEYYSANIMDYSMTLGYKISKEQKERIRNVLYYSPLIPGPKKNRSGSSTRAADGIIDLKIRTSK